VGLNTRGDYTFSTDSEKHVIIFTGKLTARLPEQEWRKVGAREKCVVPAAGSFEVAADTDVSYVCYYR
jgi:uncharacterized protein YaiE (UPF0345 family)